MIMRNLLISAALLAPLPAFAQDFGGSVTLGYGFGEVEALSQDINNLSLEGDLTVALDSNWSIGLRGSFNDVNIKGLPVGVTTNLLGANLAYSFGNGAWVGGYTENFELGISLLPVNFGTTAFGIEGGYETETMAIEGFLGSSTDLTSFGLAARYTPNAAATIGAAVIKSSLDLDLLAPGLSVDLNMVGLAGTYNVSSQFGVFAGMSRSSVSDFDADLTSFGLGASYTLTNTASPIAISLEIARTELEAAGILEADLKTLRLGITMPLGNKGSVLPHNSVASSVLNPNRSALSQTLAAVF